MIDPESAEAFELNREIFAMIKQKAVAQSEKLGRERGFPRLLTKQRNSDLLALAPNANTSVIMENSPSADPFFSNIFAHRTRAGSHVVIEKYFKELLERKGEFNEKVLNFVAENGGSVANLPFLSDHEKKVFMTAFEMDQEVLINLAAERQKFICQGQSLNFFFDSNETKKKFSQLYLKAWKKKIKGLYYLRSQTERKVNLVFSAESECSCQN